MCTSEALGDVIVHGKSFDLETFYTSSYFRLLALLFWTHKQPHAIISYSWKNNSNSFLLYLPNPMLYQCYLIIQLFPPPFMKSISQILKHIAFTKASGNFLYQLF